MPASQVAQMAKNLPIMQETQVQSLGWEGPLEKGMATHSSIFAWRIPWTTDPGWTSVPGVSKSRTWLNDEQYYSTLPWASPVAQWLKESPCNAGDAGDTGSAPGSGKITWRRAWQPTPVFLPWRIPRKEEPGGFQSLGSHRIGMTESAEHACTHTVP